VANSSRQISSNQQHPNPKLPALVRRHLDTVHRKPVAAHNLAAFRLLMEELAARPRPLVLDSFCGTGHSTAALAQRHPQHLVVGIDKSARRLARHPGSPVGNYLLLQAECEDLWQLLVREGLHADFHYLLYPNPWPKASHLQRRIHAHASFPRLLELAAAASPGRLELRSNWQLYVEEFGLAMHLAGYPGCIARVTARPALSLFERKYRDSGHALWAFRGRVRGSSPGAGGARDGTGFMG
jgi:tRNA (guanine-N7-)-methyltransferase